MNQLLYLMQEHQDWIARDLTQPGDPAAAASQPASASTDPGASIKSDSALVGAMHRLILLLLQPESGGNGSPVPTALQAPSQPALAKQADRIVAAGQSLSLAALLQASKEARRRVLELVLWSDVEPEDQVSYRRATMTAYDQLDLLVVQAWERQQQARSIHLGEAHVLQAMHYPVLIIDVSERIRWLNEAALSLWRTLQGVTPNEPRPMYLDEMIPQLALPWDAIIDQRYGRANRASFEQTLDTRSGARAFLISAWPLPAEPHATPCVALLLLDRTL